MTQAGKVVMEWDEKRFDVLVPKMNTQHEKLVAMMNQLYVRHEADAGKMELERLITELENYTIRHFMEEEAFMDSIHYPQFRVHKNVHKQLLQDFSAHHAAFTAGSGKLAPQFFDFLRRWLTAHIMQIDRKYGQFSHESHVA